MHSHNAHIVLQSTATNTTALEQHENWPSVFCWSGFPKGCHITTLLPVLCGQQGGENRKKKKKKKNAKEVGKRKHCQEEK